MYINNVYIKDGERIDDLHRNGYLIIQNTKNFCFGCDAVLLSDFARVRKNEIALDLGTGTGIIPILLSAKTEGKFFYGLEIQEECVEIASRSVELNNLQNKIKNINGDIKDMQFNKSYFDVITTNPPYLNNGGGIHNENYSLAIARHEILCSLEDIISGSSTLLKTNGHFYMIHRPHRLVQIFTLLSKYNMEPKKIRFVYPKINKEPTMILIEAVKNGKPMLKVMKPLIMYNEDGTHTDEINEIYYN